jgi:hypothetical protein
MPVRFFGSLMKEPSVGATGDVDGRSRRSRESNWGRKERLLDREEVRGDELRDESRHDRNRFIGDSLMRRSSLGKITLLGQGSRVLPSERRGRSSL